MITRRKLLTATTIGLLIARAPAQSADLPVLGALFLGDPDLSYNWKHLIAELRVLGYEDGTNVRYAARFTPDPGRLPQVAAEIATLAPTAVYANGDEPARVAAAQWSSVPIVAMTDDHIGAGLTDNFAHPSRNVTGVSRIEAELDTKRLELLHEIVPSARIEPPRVCRRLFGLSQAAMARRFEHSMVAVFGFCRWNVADGLQQPAMVEPVDPFERGELDGFE